MSAVVFLRWLTRRSRAGVIWILLSLPLIPIPGLAQTPGVPTTAVSTTSGTRLNELAQRAVAQIDARLSKPLGRVVERRRSRVYVVVSGTPPAKGTRLLVRRPVTASVEQPIGTLQVMRVTEGLVECRELQRAGRAHAEANDLVRLEGVTPRLLLAPCLTHVDLVPVIPQVIGEQIRNQLLGRNTIVLVDSLDLERRAEAAYWSGRAGQFLEEEHELDLVLFPVLLLATDKLVLNLEYFSVERGRAIDVDAVSVEIDDMLRSWIRAGRNRSSAPPGYRAMASQAFGSRMLTLAPVGGGALVAVSPDSLQLLEFAFPGLRVTAVVPLGVVEQQRREPYACIVSGADVRAMQMRLRMDGRSNLRETESGGRTAGADTIWVLSELRPPRAFAVSSREKRLQVVQTSPESAERWLADVWVALRAAARHRQQWWPRPGWNRIVMVPQIGDVDLDGRLDLLWSSQNGELNIRRFAAESAQVFPGFGDVKAIQAGQLEQSKPVLWLTEAVWNNAPDRLQAAQLIGGKLQVVWRSEPFEGTLTGLASTDLNSDGAIDLVVAERQARTTRLHVYLALPGERTAARGGAWAP